MRFAAIAVVLCIVATPWQLLRAATLIPLNSGLSAIVFSQAELPIISPDTFECERHIYKADQQYSPLANGLYHNAKHRFGVYNHCYLQPVSKALLLTNGQKIMRFISAASPHTEVVFTVHGDELSVLPAGIYRIKNGGSIEVDAKHRNVRAIQP